MTWADLKKRMTDKYCPREEMKKLERELWNLKTRGTDVVTYSRRFQELNLMCVRMFSEEKEKIEKYIGGLPDMIHVSVMASKPKSMQEAIEFANELMDQKELVTTTNTKVINLSALRGNDTTMALACSAPTAPVPYKQIIVLLKNVPYVDICLKEKKNILSTQLYSIWMHNSSYTPMAAALFARAVWRSPSEDIKHQTNARDRHLTAFKTRISPG
ncbi:reverse transcriptase domain-containing protein [Tanacetum coccineum]